jgi:hypothetical protein
MSRRIITKSFVFFVVNIWANSVEAQNAKPAKSAEKVCREIGFSPKTEPYADCIIELIDRGFELNNRSNSRAPSRENLSGNIRTGSAGQQPIELTPNARQCAQFGFKVKTTAFAQCQLELDAAQRQSEAQQRQYELQVQQHEQQVAAYNAQVAAAQRERERRQWEALARFGFGLATSRSPSLLGGVNDGFATALGIPTAPPAPPPRPAAIENYTIHTPSGRTVMCSYSTATSSMRCY